MTDQTVTPAETADQPESPEDAAKRAAFVADLCAFAAWLAKNSWVPVPSEAYASKQLNGIEDPALVAPSLAKVRDIAARFGVKTDESLPDRTRAGISFGNIEYRLLAWHKGGRPGEPDERDIELERLRAENAELRAAVPAGALPGDDGLGYSREADDPTPVSGGRLTPHFATQEGTVRDSHLVIDEQAADGSAGLVPAPIAAHYDATGWNGRAAGEASCACGETFGGVKALAQHLADESQGLRNDETPEHYEKRVWIGDDPGSCGAECACGLGYAGFDSVGEASRLLEVHIAASVDPAGAVPRP